MNKFLVLLLFAISLVVVGCEKESSDVEKSLNRKTDVGEHWELGNCATFNPDLTISGWGITCSPGVNAECPKELDCTIIINYENPQPGDTLFLQNLAAAYGYSDYSLFQQHLANDSIDLGSDHDGMNLIFDRLNL